jgi:glycosyltransferase 2 family protein
MRAVPWAKVRDASGVVILVVVVARVGLGPFLEGLRRVDARTVAVAVLIAAVTTTCCAWRWRLVARGLGIDVQLGAGVAACYRAQLLNSTLPGGVLGDVHRGLLHGQDVGDVNRSLRAVAWERAAGQAVQITLTVGLLLVLPSPVRSSAPWLALALVALSVVAVVLARSVPDGGSSRVGRVVRAALSDVRHGLLAPGAWPGVVLTSVVVVAGQSMVFVVASRTVVPDADLGTLVPLALLVLLAMAVPLSIGGWGPREGVAAWAFGAAGLGAAAGVTTAVLYGVVSLVAALPGAVVLLLDRRPRTRGARTPTSSDLSTDGGGSSG